MELVEKIRYFFVTLFRNYHRQSVNAYFSSIIIALFLFLAYFIYLTSRYNWMFWTPPKNSIEKTVQGRIEKLTSMSNGTELQAILAVKSSTDGAILYLNCEPEPYLNKCLDNIQPSVFDGRVYKIKYIDYFQYPENKIERLIMGLSIGDKEILNTSQRLEEIQSEAVLRYGSKYNHKVVRLPPDKNSKVVPSLIIGLVIFFFIKLVMVPALIKLRWSLKNGKWT